MKTFEIFKTYISICYFLLPLFTFGQSAQWEWVANSNDPLDETSRGVTTSPNGDVYTFGEFSGTLTIQGNTLEQIPGALLLNAHVSKFNSDGTLNWTFAIGGNGSILSVIRTGDTDSEGYCYIGGKILTQSPELIIADSIITLEGSGPNLPFIAKISPDGELVWVSFIEPLLENGIGAEVLFIEVSDNDELYASGQIQGIYSFGDEIISTNNLFSGYLTKIDKNTGEYVWVKTLRANDSYSFSDIITTGDGRVYVSGGWAGDTLFADNQILINDMPLVGDNYDSFVAKFSGNGDVELLERHYSSSSEYGGIFAKDESDNVFIHYTISESLVVNGVETSGPGFARYEYIADAPAQLSWIIPGFSGIQTTYYGDYDSQGNLYYGGVFESETLQLGNFSFQNSGGASGTNDIFLFTINNMGEIVWATTFGGMESENLNSVHVDESDRILLGGTYISPNMDIGDFNLTNSGDFTPNLFVAALSNPLSAKEVPNKVNLDVYPNPASTSIFIKNIPGNSEEIMIEIIDITGKLVRAEMSAHQEIINLDVSDVPAGAYTIRVSTSAYLSNSKIIIQNN